MKIKKMFFAKHVVQLLFPSDKKMHFWQLSFSEIERKKEKQICFILSGAEVLHNCSQH
jgi:hypothetical protein